MHVDGLIGFNSYLFEFSSELCTSPVDVRPHCHGFEAQALDSCALLKGSGRRGFFFPVVGSDDVGSGLPTMG